MSPRVPAGAIVGRGYVSHPLVVEVTFEVDNPLIAELPEAELFEALKARLQTMYVYGVGLRLDEIKSLPIQGRVQFE